MEGINVSQISMQAGLIKNWHTFRSLLLSLVSTILLNLIDHPKLNVERIQIELGTFWSLSLQVRFSVNFSFLYLE